MHRGIQQHAQRLSHAGPTGLRHVFQKLRVRSQVHYQPSAQLRFLTRETPQYFGSRLRVGGERRRLQCVCLLARLWRACGIIRVELFQSIRLAQGAKTLFLCRTPLF